MRKEVHTAVAVASSLDGDIEEPLLSNEGLDDHDKDIIDTKQENKELSKYSRISGIIFGSLYSTISLAASAVLARQFGEHPVLENATDKILYFALFGLSNSWLLLFPTICVIVERSWTERGHQLLNENLLHRFVDNNCLPRRAVFLAGVNFLLGIVVGSFTIWGIVDLYIGSGIDMFFALIASFCACTILCYTLVWVYDSSRSSAEKDSSDEGEGEMC